MENDNSKKPLKNDNSKKPLLIVEEKTTLTQKVALITGMIGAFLVGIIFINWFFPQTSNQEERQKLLLNEYKSAPPDQNRVDLSYLPNKILVRAKTGVKKEVLEKAIKNEIKTSRIPEESLERQKKLLQKSVGNIQDNKDNQWKIKEIDEQIKDLKKAEFKEMEKISKLEEKDVVINRWYEVTLDNPTDVKNLSKEIVNNLKEVEYAQPEYVYQPFFTPNDPYFSTRGAWGQDFDDLYSQKVSKMNLENAWDINMGSNQVTVAVSDTGVDYTHPDIDGKIWQNSDEIPDNGLDDDNNGYIDDTNGWDFTDCDYFDSYGNCLTPTEPDNNPLDNNGHGTHVAGTIAAETNNNLGVSGVCPDCMVMPVRGLTGQGYGLSSWLADTIRYAAENGARVINMSWGGQDRGTPEDQLIKDAIDYAHDNFGVIPVAAAGNESADANYYLPANHPDVITVAATDYLDRRAYFSNYGSTIEVAAPGVDILSLRAAGTDMYGDGTHIVGEDYYYCSGTSMAAPHVSGLVGLIISANPSLTKQQIRSVVLSSGEDVNSHQYPGWDNQIGNGRVNALKALQQVTNPPVIAQLDSFEISVMYQVDTVININGLAYGSNFQSYKLEYGQGEQPTSWTTLSDSTTPVSIYGTLGNLNTAEHFGYYSIRLTVNGNSGQKVTEATGISIGLANSWPKQVFSGYTTQSNPQSIQWQGDTTPSVMIGKDGNIHTGLTQLTIFNGQGNNLSGWPQYLSSGDVPAFGDINGDGVKEIVYAKNGEVHAKNKDGSNFIPNPIATWDPLYETDHLIVLADLDPSFAGNEIIVNTEYINNETGQNTQKVYAWHANGTLVSGWPIESMGGYNTAYGQEGVSPAVGDIDNNGDLEVVFVQPNLDLVVYNHNGTPFSGFTPKRLEWMPEDSPTLADLNGDQQKEILIMGGSIIYVYKNDGSLYNCFPAFIPRISGWSDQSPVVANLDNVGSPEIVVVYYRTTSFLLTIPYITVLRRNGEVISEQWPKSFEEGIGMSRVFSEPQIVDLDNDGDLEVIFGNKAYHHDGTAVGTWPNYIDYDLARNSVIGDYDDDNLLELIYPSDNKLYMWQLPYQEAPNQIIWQSLHHDSQHTNATTCTNCNNYPQPLNQCPSCSTSALECQPDHLICFSGSCRNTDCQCNEKIPYQFGWPKTTDPFTHSVPTLADINNDGKNEIVMIDANGLHVWKADGTEVEFWPYIPPPPLPWGDEYHFNKDNEPVAIGDINSDGHLEVIATGNVRHFNGQYYEFKLSIFAFDYQGHLLNGFPSNVPLWEGEYEGESNILNTVVISEAIDDPLHPGKEIVFNKSGSLGKSAVYVMHADGTIASGWPQLIQPQYTHYITSVIAEDVNYDGYKEIVTSASWYDIAQGINFAYIYVWDRNGNLINQWSVENGPILGDLIVGDLDKNYSGLEIMVGGSLGYVYAWHYDGSSLAGWSVNVLEINNPDDLYPPDAKNIVASDADLDGELEVIGIAFSPSNGPYVYIWENNGQLKNKFHFDWTSESHPLLFDIDGDSQIEIVFTDSAYGIMAWHLDGSLTDRFPISTLCSDLSSVPAYGELDGDGNGELVAASRCSRIIIWDLPWTYQGNLAVWPVHHQNSENRSMAGDYSKCSDGTFYGRCNPNNPPSQQYCDNGTLTSCPPDEPTCSVTTFQCEGVNQPPVLNPIGSKTVDEGVLLSFTISGSDPDGDSLTYSAINLPSGATFSGQTFSWTPSYSQSGTYQVTFRVSDGSLTDEEIIIITVNNINRPPILDSIGNKSVNEGQLLQFTITASDPDGDTLTYSATNLPSGAVFNSVTRIFSWTPSYSQAGSYSVTFTVTDGSLSDSETITLTVNNVNRPPVLNPIGNKTVNEGSLLTFTISGSDPDGDSLTYSVSGLPLGATFVGQTFSWTPNYNQAGNYNVTFTVSDGSLTDNETITITVNNVNPPNAPSNLTAQALSRTQIRLNWQDNSNNELGFKIERGRKQGQNINFSQITTVGANITTYTDNGLSPNTLYYYRVRAYNDAGNSAYSNTASARTLK